MALTISQIAAVSYPAVLADQRKPTNQWAANAALAVAEKGGFVVRESLGENIEVPLDYRKNPDTAVLASDQDAHPMLKTEVLTSAVYEIAQVSVPVTWTKFDEARTPSDNEKIDFATSLLVNGINSHDDELERGIFITSTSGGIELLGLDTLVTPTGAGSPGGIDASIETWWANKAEQYTDGTDIYAAYEELFNACAKGSGSGIQPTLVLSGGDVNALFGSQLQAQQIFTDSRSADAGFQVLMAKGAKWVFSHKCPANVAYLLNPKHYKIVVSKQYFRDKDETAKVPGQNAFYFHIYSAVQNVVSNRSALGVLFV